MPLPLDGLAPTARTHAEATAREIDLATRRVVETAFARSLALLTAQRAELDRCAAALLSRETLTGAELRALLDASPRREGGNG